MYVCMYVRLFVDCHVMVRMGQNQRGSACFVQFAMWRWRKQRLPSLTAFSLAEITRCSRRWQTSPYMPPPGNWTKPCVVFDSGPFAPVCENMTSSTEREVYNYLLSEEHRATKTGNMWRKLDEIWTCGFWDMRAKRQTDKQTNRQRVVIKYFYLINWCPNWRN